MTTAQVTLEDRGATLLEDGKILKVRVSGPANLQMKTWSTEPTTDYDAPNPGTILMGFECELPPDASETLQVLLMPEKASIPAPDFDQELANW